MKGEEVMASALQHILAASLPSPVWFQESERGVYAIDPVLLFRTQLFGSEQSGNSQETRACSLSSELVVSRIVLLPSIQY